MSEAEKLAEAGARHGTRSAAGFGGALPVAAIARSEGTAVLVLTVEHHAEGTAVPLVLLSEAPGLLSWEPAGGLEVADDVGTEYRVEPLNQLGALGSLATTVWLEPPVPPQARRLTLTVTGLQRLSAARGRTSVERPLTGGPWTVEVDMLPDRTNADPPSEPPGAEGAVDRPSRVPGRSVEALEGVMPVGQARIRPGVAISVWAVERYADRAVMSVGLLADPPLQAAHLFPGTGHVEVWDDLGRRYRATPTGGTTGPGWSESAIEIVPPPDPAARTLGIRLEDLPLTDPDGQPVDLEPLTFGVAALR